MTEARKLTRSSWERLSLKRIHVFDVTQNIVEYQRYLKCARAIILIIEENIFLQFSCPFFDVLTLKACP